MGLKLKARLSSQKTTKRDSNKYVFEDEENS
jgi:hypothetical protein